MAFESFSFDKGVNRKKGRIYLQDGEVYTISGASFEHDGLVECRIGKTRGEYIDNNTDRHINGIHRYENAIYASSVGACYNDSFSDDVGQIDQNNIFFRFNEMDEDANILINGNFDSGLANWTDWSDANGKCDVENGTLILGNDGGSELITNGTFTSNITGWTDISTGTGDAQYSAGTLELQVGASGVAKAVQGITTDIGATYTITFDKSGIQSAFCYIGSTSGGSDVHAIACITGSNTDTFIATSTTTYISFWCNIDDAHPHIDNVSCKDTSTTYTGWVEQQFTTIDGVEYTVTLDLVGEDLDTLYVGTTSKGIDLFGYTDISAGILSDTFTASGTTAFIHFKSTAASPYSQIKSIAVTSGGASIAWAYTNMMNGSARPQFVDAETFTFVVDGKTKKAYIEDKVYEWGIENPTRPPNVADSGNAGNPSGTYNCYYSYYITFPNGKVVETDLSPAASVTVATNAISWTHVPLCKYGGEDLVIWRRLYRDVSGTIYYLDDIRNNTTQTYTDDLGDASLQLQGENSTEDYGPPPQDMVDITWYLQRIFGVKDNKLHWSESYQPFVFKNTSNIAVEKEDTDLIAVVNWGDTLWMPSVYEWFRLSGSDPDTWSIKRTFTDVGAINRATIKATKYGILGLWNDGVYLFDGHVAHNMTDPKLGRDFFSDMDDLTVCYAEFDGYRYKFYYASSGTTVDSCFVIDFTNYPNYRIYFEDWIPDALEYYKQDNRYYYAKTVVSGAA